MIAKVRHTVSSSREADSYGMAGNCLSIPWMF